MHLQFPSMVRPKLVHLKKNSGRVAQTWLAKENTDLTDCYKSAQCGF